MTRKRQRLVPDDLLSTYLRREWDLRRRILEGTLPLDWVLNQMQKISQGEAFIQEGMSLEEAKKIRGLVVIGPEEIANLFGVPLESIPNPPLAISRERLEAKMARRGNKLGLILRLKKIGHHRLNICFLNNQFGKEGKIKKDLLCSDPYDQYIEDKEATFVRQPVCQIKAEWILADLELPPRSFYRKYCEQKEDATKHGLRMKTASSDVYDLLLVAAVTGERYRRGVLGSTADTYSIFPVLVGHFVSKGLGGHHSFYPSDRYDYVGPSCEEVVS